MSKFFQYTMNKSKRLWLFSKERALFCANFVFLTFIIGREMTEISMFKINFLLRQQLKVTVSYSQPHTECAFWFRYATDLQLWGNSQGVQFHVLAISLGQLQKLGCILVAVVHTRCGSVWTDRYEDLMNKPGRVIRCVSQAEILVFGIFP